MLNASDDISNGDIAHELAVAYNKYYQGLSEFKGNNTVPDTTKILAPKASNILTKNFFIDLTEILKEGASAVKTLKKLLRGLQFNRGPCGVPFGGCEAEWEAPNQKAYEDKIDFINKNNFNKQLRDYLDKQSIFFKGTGLGYDCSEGALLCKAQTSSLPGDVVSVMQGMLENNVDLSGILNLDGKRCIEIECDAPMFSLDDWCSLEQMFTSGINVFCMTWETFIITTF